MSDTRISTGGGGLVIGSGGVASGVGGAIINQSPGARQTVEVGTITLAPGQLSEFVERLSDLKLALLSSQIADKAGVAGKVAELERRVLAAEGRIERNQVAGLLEFVGSVAGAVEPVMRAVTRLAALCGL